MTPLDVRITGICCHYFYNDKIRTILVEASKHPYFPHYAHIEVQRGGVIDAAGLTPLRFQGQPYYRRDGVAYEAYRLQRHRLDIPNTGSGLPHLQPNFENQVPHLPDVCRTFGNRRILDFVADNPTAPVAAHLDLTGGVLDVTDSSEPTHFEPKHKDPRQNPGQDRRLATEVRLRLNINGNPYINVTPFGASSSRRFVLEPWVTKIRIGNLCEEGIKGIPESDAHHFLLYYMMADEGAACYAIPVEVPNQSGKGLGGGCTNTGYP